MTRTSTDSSNNNNSSKKSTDVIEIEPLRSSAEARCHCPTVYYLLPLSLLYYLMFDFSCSCPHCHWRRRASLVTDQLTRLFGLLYLPALCRLKWCSPCACCGRYSCFHFLLLLLPGLPHGDSAAAPRPRFVSSFDHHIPSSARFRLEWQ